MPLGHIQHPVRAKSDIGGLRRLGADVVECLPSLVLIDVPAEDRILPDEAGRRYWSWVAAWDPRPHTARITCPTLLLFGERDDQHPTPLAVQRWREGLAEAGNERATVVVFPGAGHGIRMRAGHDGPGRAPFADGYEDLMIGWLWRNVVAGGR